MIKAIAPLGTFLMSNMHLIIATYIIVVLITIYFFTKYGKKIGFDYSGPHDPWYNDWSNNTQAYTAFGLLWPIMIPILVLYGGWKLLTMFTGKFIKN